MTSCTPTQDTAISGIILLNKPENISSFTLVKILRRLTRVKKIGHAGTLDPFASGVMILLIGKDYTRQADTFTQYTKGYRLEVTLGRATTTYDTEGDITAESSVVPEKRELENALLTLSGDVLQTPPMFSAKKVNGQKLYQLARKGQEIERKPVQVHIQTKLIHYDYPKVVIDVTCSKGTYMRTLAHDLGNTLKCYGFASKLVRTRSGPFTLDQCIDVDTLKDSSDVAKHLWESVTQK